MLAAVVLLAGFAWFAFRSVQPDVMELSYPRKYKSIVTEQAAEYDLEESLVYAVIKAESNFDAEAVSSVGAVGLMQMMPETFYWMQTHVGETYDESALYEPGVSIRFGCALLRLLLSEYGDLDRRALRVQRRHGKCCIVAFGQRVFRRREDPEGDSLRRNRSVCAESPAV